MNKNRSKGHAPQRIFVVAAVALMVLYCANIAYSLAGSGDPERQAMVQTHLENLGSPETSVEGLILGGSNAVYGLSAELLSQELRTNFYNLSFLNEAYNLENYDALMGEAALLADFSKVKIVIWSSVQIYYTWDRQDRSRNLVGEFYPSIIPSMSLLRNIKQGYGRLESRQGRIINRYGDLDFYSVECVFPMSGAYGRYPNPAFLAYVTQVISMLRKRFPSARVVIVAPSLFDSPKVPESYVQEIKAFTTDLEAEFIIQSEIERRGEICDAYHHPNEAGRSKRTQNLATMLSQ